MPPACTEVAVATERALRHEGNPFVFQGGEESASAFSKYFTPQVGVQSNPMRKRLSEAFIAVVVEESVRKFIPPLLPYAWLAILWLLTWEILQSEKVKKLSGGIYSKLNKWERMLSFLIVAIVGAGISVTYWLGIRKAFAVNSTSAITEVKPGPTSTRPESKPPETPTSPSPTPDQEKPPPLKTTKPPEKPRPPVLTIEDIKSIVVVLRTTLIPKPGAVFLQGDQAFAYFPMAGSSPIASVEGPQGKFPLELAQTLNVYIQEDNRVV